MAKNSSHDPAIVVAAAAYTVDSWHGQKQLARSNQACCCCCFCCDFCCGFCPSFFFISFSCLQSISPPSLSDAESVYGGLMLEIVLTFGLVYTVLATAAAAADSRARSGSVGLLAPLAIGLAVGTNILVGGAFDGASMNPALAFGPALISWDFTNQWLYWIGPLIGASFATLIHDTLLDPHSPFHSSIEK
jgi:hypothetical protein